MEAIRELTYLEQCNKHFAPLDEISEALINHEKLAGYQMSAEELLRICSVPCNLRDDLIKYEGERFPELENLLK